MNRSGPWDIAIVGMAGRFPGAGDMKSFWDVVVDRRDVISRFDSMVSTDGPDFVGAKGLLEGAERFDASFFGISDDEAALMDPQHRVFLECAWHALEDAGSDPWVEQRTGVFAAARLNTFALRLLARDGDLDPEDMRFVVSQDKDFLSSRVAFHFGLTGPAISVQTACSGSLVAVSMACQSLLMGQCDAAVAGGVRVSVPLRAGYRRSSKGVLSTNGHCRPFDAAANGTVFSDGVGAVVLRPLSAALERGDRIYAVIKAVAVNNDGRDRMSFTAPSAKGQAQVVKDAMAQARLTPEEIELIECHGTGTLLGDPIEVEGLIDSYGHAKREAWCSLSSIKANFGHMSAAAGVASLIKAALALHNRIKPPQANFNILNPALSLEGAPFRIDTVATPFTAKFPAAAVSSFGFGGTNAHAVLTAAPRQSVLPLKAETRHIIYVTAATYAALDRLDSQMRELIVTCEPDDLALIAEISRNRRTHFIHRRALVIDSALVGRARIEATLEGQAPAAIHGGTRAPFSILLSSRAGPVTATALPSMLAAGLRPSMLATDGPVEGITMVIGDLGGSARLLARVSGLSRLALEWDCGVTPAHGVRLYFELGECGTEFEGQRRGIRLNADYGGKDVAVQIASLWVQGAPIARHRPCAVGPVILDRFPKYPFVPARHWPATLDPMP